MSTLRQVEEAIALTKCTIGSDEVGYGSWAGPLVVCAVALPQNWYDPCVKDSKKLTQKKREDVYDRFSATTTHAVVVRSSKEIDEIGVWNTLLDAHKKAIEAVASHLITTFVAIIDGNLPINLDRIQTYSLPKADHHIQAVALASIFAKVTRDRMMMEFADLYKGYGFASHYGYGTADHAEALKRLGPCPIHRYSYKPIASSPHRDRTGTPSSGSGF